MVLVDVVSQLWALSGRYLDMVLDGLTSRKTEKSKTIPPFISHGDLLSSIELRSCESVVAGEAWKVVSTSYLTHVSLLLLYGSEKSKRPHMLGQNATVLILSCNIDATHGGIQEHIKDVRVCSRHDDVAQDPSSNRSQFWANHL